MPKKADKSSAKPVAPKPEVKSKSQERREAIQGEAKKQGKGDSLAEKLEATGKLSAAELRQAKDNGLVEDKQIVELAFPEGSNLVGYGAMYKGQQYTRQAELTVPGHAEQKKATLAKMKASLEEFLPTIKEPTEDPIDNIS